MKIKIELSDEDIELLHLVRHEFNKSPCELKTFNQIKLLQLLSDKVHQAERPELFIQGDDYEHND